MHDYDYLKPDYDKSADELANDDDAKAKLNERKDDLSNKLT